MTMEPTLSSETSAFILRAPGKFPKEHRLHLYMYVVSRYISTTGHKFSIVA